MYIIIDKETQRTLFQVFLFRQEETEQKREQAIIKKIKQMESNRAVSINGIIKEYHIVEIRPLPDLIKVFVVDTKTLLKKIIRNKY